MSDPVPTHSPVILDVAGVALDAQALQLLRRLGRQRRHERRQFGVDPADALPYRLLVRPRRGDPHHQVALLGRQRDCLLALDVRTGKRIWAR